VRCIVCVWCRSDLGGSTTGACNVHPQDKREIGERMARSAERIAYGVVSDATVWRHPRVVASVDVASVSWLPSSEQLIVSLRPHGVSLCGSHSARTLHSALACTVHALSTLHSHALFSLWREFCLCGEGECVGPGGTHAHQRAALRQRRDAWTDMRAHAAAVRRHGSHSACTPTPSSTLFSLTAQNGARTRTASRALFSLTALHCVMLQVRHATPRDAWWHAPAR
jgi:hypothetical protein